MSGMSGRTSRASLHCDYIISKTKIYNIQLFVYMYNQNNNIQVTPKLIKWVVTGVAALVVVIVAMAFITPWYNVWSQEMEGKAEFAKAEQNRKIKIEEAKANLEPRNSMLRPKSSAPKAPPRQSASKTALLRPPISNICGCASSPTSATRP